MGFLHVIIIQIIQMILVSAAQENITADVGKTVILPCKVPNNSNNIPIKAIEWVRPELDPEYVLLYRDERFDLENQHASFKNRVDLQDKEMKDGDASLILKDVKMEDRGRYKCCVFQGELHLIAIIDLEVYSAGDKDGGNKDGGDKDGGNKVGVSRGHLGVVGPILSAVLVSVGFVISRRRSKNPNLPVPPDEAAAEQML